MAEVIRRVRPTEVHGYLANPHRGCCTFQHFNGDPLFPGMSWAEEGPTEFPPAVADVIEGYLPTTVAYCRWFWEILEPEEGKYDFTVIERSLETCAERGQTLAVRLMAYGSSRQAQVPAWYAAKYPMTEYLHKTNVLRVPDLDSPEYLDKWGGLVQEFARRYDSHPLLESIDITYIGPWGEGAGKCTFETCRRFARLWQEAFVRTPRIALLGGEQVKAGIETGAGWRADCFGDLRDRGSHEVVKPNSFNHMYDSYPNSISKSGATENWKVAPVHFETCGVPMHWFKGGHDIDFILRQGLKYHTTYFMPKSARLPDEWMEKLADFCSRLGYRYVYRQATVESPAKAGTDFWFHSWIENVGVAPIYRRYDFAVRLSQNEREEIVILDDVDIRQWMPGDAIIDTTIKLPEWIKPGWVELAAGLVDPETRKARISFSAKEVFNDRWLSLNGFVVE